MPLVAAKTNTGLTADCTELTIDDTSITIIKLKRHRSHYGDKNPGYAPTDGNGSPKISETSPYW